jgi:hypothetical protein
MHPQATHSIYEFGDFELDALRRVLVSPLLHFAATDESRS